MSAQRIGRGGSLMKRPPVKNEKHLRFIRELPCCICNSRSNVHAAHIRMCSPRYGKMMTGMGVKPDDRWTVPLCARHHVFGEGAQHTMSEDLFWRTSLINPFVLALTLWGCTGDVEAAMTILIEARSP